jgi:glutamine amidotransferase
MLVILDYKVGNLASIKNMLKKVGCADALITDDLGAIKEADKFILPGVGNFDFGMKQLLASGFIETVGEQVLVNKKPILGICLGAQLMTQSSEEGQEKGLGWVDGKTVKFDKSRLDSKMKIPHMGWTDVDLAKDSKLFLDMHPDPRFYFVHTYHMVLDEPENILTRSRYGYEFTSGFEKGNLMGVQYHPEKSHKFGMQMLKNYVEQY